ncbi:MAG TPA: hypothetical protein VGA92_02045 [Candidatus Nitrosotenuis sp.]|jgi:hypothetical protein
MSKEPRSVIVKTMVVDRPTDRVFDFFANPKNWESGGALKNIRPQSDGWWLADSPFGSSKFKLHPNKEAGILDHDFIGEGEWIVFVRITPNERGSTISWTFIRPEAMIHERFECQLQNFDKEIEGWKKAIELT